MVPVGICCGILGAFQGVVLVVSQPMFGINSPMYAMVVVIISFTPVSLLGIILRWQFKIALKESTSYIIFNEISSIKNMLSDYMQHNHSSEIHSHHQMTPMFSRLSHEINTSLNAIIGASQLLIKTSCENKESIDIIDHTSKVLSNLINDLLDLEQLQSDALVLVSQKFSIYSTFQRIQKVFGSEAKRRNILLDFNIELETDCAYGDRSRLTQIVINLLCNSFRAVSSNNGRIIVTVKGNKQGTIQCSVSDNGCGISPEAQAQLFIPFLQGEYSCSNNTQEHPGCGLGLFISNKLIKLMNGDIHISSVPGIGTEVVFEINLKVTQSSEFTPCFSTTSFFDDIRPRISRWPSIGYARNPIIVPSNQRHRIDHPPIHSVGSLKRHLSTVSNLLERVNNMSGSLYHTPQERDANSPRDFRGCIPSYVPSPSYLKKESKEVSFTEKSEKKLQDPTSNENQNQFSELHSIRHGLSQIYQEQSSNGNDSVNPQLSPLPACDSTKFQDIMVVVIDDNLINRRVLSKLVEVSFSCDSKAFSSADEALFYINEINDSKRILVLTDIHMPGTDGLQLARVIRMKYPPTNIPIIGITADRTTTLHHICLEAGMQAVLTKPILQGNLQDAVLGVVVPLWGCIDFVKRN